VLELWAECAERAEQRESELGHPVPNCPTATEIRRTAEIVNEIFSAGEMTAQQAADLQAELAGISDKWLNPESDPVGVLLHPVLEGVIDGLNHELRQTHSH
jgi:hypothetical protein